MAIVENCSSSEGESEKQDERHHVNLAHNSEEKISLREGKMPLSDLIPEEELQYDAGLLEKVSVAKATDQMTFIIHFVYLSTDQKYFKTLQEKYKNDDTAEQTKTPEALINYLRGKAFEAISEKPTLMAYLQELRQRNEGVIALSKKLLDHRSLLLDSHQSQRKTIKEFSEQFKAQSEQIKEQQEKINGLYRDNKSQSEIIQTLSEQITTHEKKIDEFSRKDRASNEIIEKLSQEFREQKEQIGELSQKILLQSEIVPNIPEKVRVHNEVTQPLEKPDHFQKYVIPLAASFALGVSVTTIYFLRYYKVTKTI
jgi:hypothetical protein